MEKKKYIEPNYRKKKYYNTAKYPIRQPLFFTWLIQVLSKMMLCTKGVNMVKEIVMDPDDIIEYVRNNVKVDDIFELSYNRVFAPGTVLGLTPEDEETGEGLILSLQLNGELLNQAVDIDLHKVKDEIIEFRHMPGGDEDKLIIVEASL